MSPHLSAFQAFVVNTHYFKNRTWNDQSENSWTDTETKNPSLQKTTETKLDTKCGGRNKN